MKTWTIIMVFCCMTFLFSKRGGTESLKYTDQHRDIYIAQFFPRAHRTHFPEYRENKDRYKISSQTEEQKADLKNDPNYQKLVQELNLIVSMEKYEIFKIIDNFEVLVYWELGKKIIEDEANHLNEPDYGSQLMANLGQDLAFSIRELYTFVRFYNLFSDLDSVSLKLSWRHYIVLMGENDDTLRYAYKEKALKNSWTYRQLKRVMERNQ